MEQYIQIDLPIEAIQTYCEKQPIQRLSLFGSVLRDDFTRASDIDMLVDYMPNSGMTLFDMAQQEYDLTDIIGRKVDLRTPNELSKYFRQKVINLAVLIYDT
ncbi:MAG: nucleotidyltransferase domain-containing protein [Anaerolineae bacterium]|nr:nucleotidyltransferase domain-containing protein [Anaerolineae bacterium]